MSAGIDIHKMIGKLPGHHYTGPYNDLNSQQKYDLKTGEILEIYWSTNSWNRSNSYATWCRLFC